MKKFQTHGKRDEEKHPRIQQRERPKTAEIRTFTKQSNYIQFHTHDKWNEEENLRTLKTERIKNGEIRTFSEHVSFGQRENYFAHENKPVKYHKQHSYQVDNKSRSVAQAFVEVPRDKDVLNDSKITNCKKNPTNEYESSEGRGTEQSDYTENSMKVHKGVHPLCPNKGNAYPYSVNPTSKAIYSKSANTEMKLKNEFSVENNVKTESFNLRRNSNELSVNEENSIKNLDVKSHCNNDNSLPVFQKHSTPYYESSQSLYYYNKQSNDQSNAYAHDLPENVYMHEEKVEPEINNIQNDSASFKNTGFNMFKITDLLHYKVDLMQGHVLFEYASAVKSKILEKIDKFQYPERDELEFLCEITDGDQSEKNQLIITTRTCRIVGNILEKFPHILNSQEILLPSQMLVYQTVPNMLIRANSYCNNYKSAQNYEITSATDNNLISNCNIVKNDKCIISKEIAESFNDMKSDGCSDYCEIQNSNSNNARNNSSTNSSLNMLEKDVAEETYKHDFSPPPASSGDCMPACKFSFNKKDSVFINFNLNNLLNYDVHVMQGDMVFDYGFSMKQRVLDNICNFMEPYEEKLKFLCAITDGTQNESNQKLINQRMCELIIENYHLMKKYEHEQSKNVHPSKSSDENKTVYEHRQNISDGGSRIVHVRSREDAVVHEQKRNSGGLSKNVHSRRSHDQDEIVHEHKRNSNGQSKNVHSRRSHDEDKMVHEYKQNLDGQSKNVHSRRSYYEDEMVNRHRRNFSGGQSSSINQSRSYHKDEMVQDHRQNFTGRQTKNVPSAKSFYSDVRND